MLRIGFGRIYTYRLKPSQLLWILVSFDFQSLPKHAIKHKHRKQSRFGRKAIILYGLMVLLLVARRREDAILFSLPVCVCVSIALASLLAVRCPAISPLFRFEMYLVPLKNSRRYLNLQCCSSCTRCRMPIASRAMVGVRTRYGLFG